MSILTPEQLDWQARIMKAYDGAGLGVFTHTVAQANALGDTLAAYAEVVQKVAEMEDIVLMEDGARLVGNCMFCGGVIGLEEEHEEDCPYLKARKLRGLE